LRIQITPACCNAGCILLQLPPGAFFATLFAKEMSLEMHFDKNTNLLEWKEAQLEMPFCVRL
jgi:hypothetical protein